MLQEVERLALMTGRVSSLCDRPDIKNRTLVLPIEWLAPEVPVSLKPLNVDWLAMTEGVVGVVGGE
jgi:hypothetical protein